MDSPADYLAVGGYLLVQLGGTALLLVLLARRLRR
jgi:hypothetical protein